MRTLVTLSASVLAFGMTLAATDLSGTWSGLIPTRNGDMQDVTFKFIHTGDTLTGKLYRDTVSAPISDGKISSEQISFVVIAEEQVGNLFLPLKYTFTGKIKDGEIVLMREREANPNLGTGGPNRGPQKPIFTLKRLF
jgi:hypothetical protein